MPDVHPRLPVPAVTRQAVAVRPPPSYRDGNVLRWLAGFGVSLVGDQVYFVALAWTATQVAGAGAAGLVLACAVMAAAAVATATAEPTLTVLVVVALVFGAVDAVFLPAVGALPPYLVAAEHLARLQGMRITMARGAIVAGAPLGGAIVAAYGIAAAFALNASPSPFRCLRSPRSGSAPEWSPSQPRDPAQHTLGVFRNWGCVAEWRCAGSEGHG